MPRSRVSPATPKLLSASELVGIRVESFKLALSLMSHFEQSKNSDSVYHLERLQDFAEVINKFLLEIE